MDIDAVITWVDGNDPVWQNKINNYLEKKIDFSKKKESVRYNSIGEIQFALRTIIKFAPFLRNIFLVTDNQTPEGFEQLKKLAQKSEINLELIDHKIIFKGYEEYLPTFNSCSIGSMLFRIPNLSDHFIIFNDDTFLMRETKPSDYFINGEPIIRGKWKKFDENRILRNIYHTILSQIGLKKEKTTPGFKKFQQNSAKLAGTKNYLRRFHTPVCLRRSTLENFFIDNQLLRENVSYRFRHESQFIVSSLSEHLEIKNGTYHFRKNKQLTYFRSYKNHLIVKIKLWYFSINTQQLFMTFQSLELAKEKTINYILLWLEKRLN